MVARSINVESLTFVDLTRYDSMFDDNTFQAFKQTPVGAANVRLVEQEIKGQGFDPLPTRVQRSFAYEQISQQQGITKPDLTDQEMLDRDNKSTPGFRFNNPEFNPGGPRSMMA